MPSHPSPRNIGHAPRPVERPRAPLSPLDAQPCEREISARGRILAVDVHARTFLFSEQDSLPPILGPLTTEHEAILMRALVEHRTFEVHLSGRGEYCESFGWLGITAVDAVEDFDEYRQRNPQRTIGELIDDAFADVPDEAWATLPRDLTERHDDYFAEIGDGG